MVDVILILYSLGLLAAGFWAGTTFGSFKAMAARGKAWARSLFDSAPKP